MYLEMACPCGALINIDGADETFTTLMAVRFADSHAECGFVTPIAGDTSITVSRKRLLDLNFNDEE